MNKEQQIEEQLWSYIDGSSTPSEKTFIERMLASHEEWKTKYKEQLELHQMLMKETELEQPSLRFTKNVMEGIAGIQPKQATNTYINKYIIRCIAAFFILTISSMLVYAFSQLKWTSSSNSKSLFSFELKNMQLPSYEFSKLFNSNVLYLVFIVAIVLGLMLLDGFLRSKKSYT